jgi:hypothetical protein
MYVYSEVSLIWPLKLPIASDTSTAYHIHRSQSRWDSSQKRKRTRIQGVKLRLIERFQALIHAESTKEGHLEHHKAIKLSTYGIIFMGTPHQGVSTTLGNMILSVASVVIKTNSNLVEFIERDGTLLEGQLQSYRGINRDFDNVYCYETKCTPPSGKLVSFCIFVCMTLD